MAKVGIKRLMLGDVIIWTMLTLCIHILLQNLSCSVCDCHVLVVRWMTADQWTIAAQCTSLSVPLLRHRRQFGRCLLATRCCRQLSLAQVPPIYGSEPLYTVSQKKTCSTITWVQLQLFLAYSVVRLCVVEALFHFPPHISSATVLLFGNVKSWKWHILSHIADYINATMTELIFVNPGVKVNRH